MSAELVNFMTGVLARIAEIERRQDGRITQGPVHSVDAAKGTCRVRIGGTDAEPFLSAEIPYTQMMGAFKGHIPVSPGQQVTIISGAGDYRQGLAIPMTKSDQNPSPSSSGNENVVTFGGATLKLDGDGLTITKGSVTVKISGSNVEITGDVKITGKFEVNGNTFEHNSKNVGFDHKHTEVVHGGELSGPPE